MKILKEIWNLTPEGKEIYRYTLENSSGASVKLGSLGAALLAACVPDKEGRLCDVVLGYPDAMSYLADGPCAGKVPGRYANRIALGRFVLDGKTYELPVNNGPNHLHGGPCGFQNQVWDSFVDGDSLVFSYKSSDGEMGFPGNVEVKARYTWSEDNSLSLELSAITDAPTHINLTNHAYFNLDGEGAGSVLDHEMKLNASAWLPTDSTLIPLGKLASVADTPMDFSSFKALGRDIKADFDALKYGKGYDNCWVVDNWDGSLRSVAMLRSATSGRTLEVLSTQPGIQVYTGNWLSGSPVGKCGRSYEDYDGVAMECQHYPDSPNRPEFPTTVLCPGERFEETIVFAFGVTE